MTRRAPLARDRIPHVVAVRVVRPHVLEVTFDDGLVRERDVSHLRYGVFARLYQDPDAFADVFVDHELGTVAWPGDIQLDPLVLHGDYEPVARPIESIE